MKPIYRAVISSATLESATWSKGQRGRENSIALNRLN